MRSKSSDSTSHHAGTYGMNQAARSKQSEGQLTSPIINQGIDFSVIPLPAAHRPTPLRPSIATSPLHSLHLHRTKQRTASRSEAVDIVIACSLPHPDHLLS